LKYEIEDLNVPGDREGKFRTALFDPYARSIGIDELIISLYSKGISTRKMSEILESIFQNRYSRSSIPRITEITIEEVKGLKNRPLDGRYIGIFLDALFFYLRRDTVEKEPIIFAMGIEESGEYEIPGFYISSKESHLSHNEVINDLYSSGVREPLLFIADGIPKLDEEIRRVYPKSYFQLFSQLFTIHASRNFESEVREYDVDIIDPQLKQIFLSEDREEAIKRFNEFKSIWENKYPKQVYNLERKLNYLFTYFQYPKPIRRSIHSNIIEIMNKEIRRRIKTIG